MKKFKLNKSDLSFLHDAVFYAYSIELTDEEIMAYYNKLPEHLRNEAILWGVNDTQIRDAIVDMALERKKK